ncbi:hypothetical protein CSOJ01_00773 [Colletotrichum sojae]|uniref:Uncharacterized protein n=1 Tax=Colletotrichum sojae TaxID=2175907 RepID=A0A8H6N4X0_9PEZI|nr:hypothetical protein CSOJ01_00773 [Colletotrichum sojae]
MVRQQRSRPDIALRRRRRSSQHGGSDNGTTSDEGGGIWISHLASNRQCRPPTIGLTHGSRPCQTRRPWGIGRVCNAFRDGEREFANTITHDTAGSRKEKHQTTTIPERHDRIRRKEPTRPRQLAVRELSFAKKLLSNVFDNQGPHDPTIWMDLEAPAAVEKGIAAPRITFFFLDHPYQRRRQGRDATDEPLFTARFVRAPAPTRAATHSASP